MSTKIKVTLNGRGGVLDCRVVDKIEDANDAVKDIALNCVFDDGDTIKIEEIEINE